MSPHITVDRQLIELAATLLLGLALGCLYELFRLIRQHSGALISLLCDVLFCVFAAAALFLHGMSVGEGELRLYMPFAVLGGAALYFYLFGSEFRRITRRVGKKIVIFLRKVSSPILKLFSHIKKYCENLKNVFSRLKKRFTIIANNAKVAAMGKKRKEDSPVEESNYETYKIRHTYENSDPGTAGVRRHRHHFRKRQDSSRGG